MESLNEFLNRRVKDEKTKHIYDIFTPNTMPWIGFVNYSDDPEEKLLDGANNNPRFYKRRKYKWVSPHPKTNIRAAKPQIFIMNPASAIFVNSKVLNKLKSVWSDIEVSEINVESEKYYAITNIPEYDRSEVINIFKSNRYENVFVPGVYTSIFRITGEYGIYCDDAFKSFIESNNITGVFFNERRIKRGIF